MADRVLQGFLVALTELSESSAGALWVVDRDKPRLETALNIDQAAIDAVTLAWTGRRAQLERGEVVRVGRSALWGSRDQAGLVALAYVMPAPDATPSQPQRDVCKLAVEHIRRTAKPSIVAEVASEPDPDEQLQLALSKCAGNVAATSRLLGVSRQTVYERMDRLGLVPRHYRIR
jgi:DNA-binding NtrC family response regulator